MTLGTALDAVEKPPASTRPQTAYSSYINLALFAVAYVVAGYLGARVSVRSDFTTLWLPNGVFIAALLLTPDRRRWPRIVLAALVANLTFDLLHGRDALLSLSYFVANGTESVLGAWLFQRFVSTSPRLDRTRDVFGLWITSALAAPAVGAAIGSTVTWINHTTADPTRTFMVWFASDALGVMLMTPLVLAAVAAYAEKAWRSPTGTRALVEEATTLLAASFLFVALAFDVFDHNWVTSWLGALALIIAAWRFGILSASIVGTLFTFTLLPDVVRIPEAFGGGPVELRVLAAQTFIALSLLVAYLMSAAQRSLEEASSALESEHEQVKERNRFVDVVLEHSPIGFAVNTVHDGQRVFVAQRFCDIYGVDAELMNSVDDYFENVYVDPDYREQMRERIVADMATGDAARMRWLGVPLTTATGEDKVVDIVNIPLLEQDLMISTVQDVTARYVATERLSESEARYRALADNSPVAVFVNTDDRVSYANRACAELFGVPEASELLGRSIYDLFAPDYREVVRDRVETLRSEFRPVTTIPESIVKMDDGELVEVEVCAAPFKDGDTTSIHVVLQDVTQRRLTEERTLLYQQRLRDLAAELSAARDREKRQLAVELHDGAAQILVSAKFKAQALAAGASDPKAAADARELVELVSEGLAEIRGVTSELAPSVVVGQGLHGGLEWLSDRLERLYGLQCTLEVADMVADLDQEVVALAFRIVREALNNVVRHAQTAEARVFIEVDDEVVSVRVEDDGAGFDASVDGDWSRRGGFGLLSIHEECAARGGDVAIASKPGAGTTFRVAIPRR